MSATGERPSASENGRGSTNTPRKPAGEKGIPTEDFPSINRGAEGLKRRTYGSWKPPTPRGSARSRATSKSSADSSRPTQEESAVSQSRRSSRAEEGDGQHRRSVCDSPRSLSPSRAQRTGSLPISLRDEPADPEPQTKRSHSDLPQRGRLRENAAPSTVRALSPTRHADAPRRASISQTDEKAESVWERPRSRSPVPAVKADTRPSVPSPLRSESPAPSVRTRHASADRPHQSEHEKKTTRTTETASTDALALPSASAGTEQSRSCRRSRFREGLPEAPLSSELSITPSTGNENKAKELKQVKPASSWERAGAHRHVEQYL